MLMQLGKDDKTGQSVVMDTQRAINGHLQIAGGTGVGKTHRIRKLVESIVQSAHELKKPIRIHAFDPHGDLDLPWCSEVKFSDATPYGYNPFDINPDPDYGGVRRSIQKFISSVQKHKTLGTKQEAVLRYLLEDLYAAKGFLADKPSTWIPDDAAAVNARMRGKDNRLYLDVKFEQIAHFKKIIKTDNGWIGGFDDELKCWWVNPDAYGGDLLMWQTKNLFKAFPTIDELVRFTEQKLKAQYCGTNSAAIALLEDVNRAASGYHRKLNELAKKNASQDETEILELEDKRDEAIQKAVDAYEGYLNSIKTGRELDDLIRYGSNEVLKSVYERLQNLRAIGIYRAVAPPFDSSKPVWRYGIKSLDIPVQRMLADLVSYRIFERAMQRGIQSDVIEIIIVDEGKRFVSGEENNIFETISNEARKFGLALWVASQSPTHFPDDFIKATGTIIVLGLSEADANVTERKLGIEPSLLAKIKPRHSALVQIKNGGELNSIFRLINFA